MPEITVVAEADLPPVLAAVLSRAVGRAAARQVDAFLQYVRASGAQCLAWRHGLADAPTAAVVALLLPGNTAIVSGADPASDTVDAAAQRAALTVALADLRERPLHYIQALLEPEEVGKEADLLDSGFRRLATLEYLERGVRFPWSDPPPADKVAWTPYRAETHDEFVRVVAETYENSLDCPELTGLRPMEDVLAAHRASGEFVPELWQLARVGSAHVGCILLSKLPSASVLEIVYMGVLASYRRRGVGRLLMQRAVEQARLCKAQRMTVVVDQRNAPARALYGAFSFAPIATRVAYLLVLNRDGA